MKHIELDLQTTPSFHGNSDVLMLLFFGFGQLVFTLPEALLIAMSGMGIVALISLARQRAFIPKNSIVLLWLPLAFTSIFFVKLLSSIWAISPKSAIDNAFNHVHFLLWPLVFYYLLTRPTRIASIAIALSISFMAMLTWAVIARALFPASEQAACFYAGVHNCGLLIQTLAVSVLLLVWTILSTELPHVTRRIVVVGILSAFVVLWITERRTEWITLFICIPVLYMTQSRKKIDAKVVSGIALSSIVLLAIIMSSNSRFKDAATEALMFQKSMERTESITTSVGSRLHMYKIGIKAIAAKPFFGWGAGIKPRHLNEVDEELRNPHPYSHFHNQYIQLLLEIGVVGAVVTVLLIGFIVRVTIIASWSGSRRQWAGLLAVLFLYHAVRGLANHSFGYSAPNAFFVVITAWICAEILRPTACIDLRARSESTGV